MIEAPVDFIGQEFRSNQIVKKIIATVFEFFFHQLPLPRYLQVFFTKSKTMFIQSRFKCLVNKSN